MANQGHWQNGDIATPDKLNSGQLQKGTTASFDDAFTGMEVWDNSTGKVHRAKGDGLGWEAVIDVDAPVSTGSLRTLGTGAQQAAAGNHTHSPISDGNTPDEQKIQSNVQILLHMGQAFTNTETSLETLSRTPNAANHALVGAAGIDLHYDGNNGDAAVCTLRLKVDDVTKVSFTTPDLTTGGGSRIHYRKALIWLESNPSVASHTFKLTGQGTSAGNPNVDAEARGLMTIQEVKV